MGKRGRPPKFVKTLTFRMDPQSIARLQCLAAEWGTSNSEAVRELIARGVYETFDARARAERGIS
jgi:predicted DNA-binding protein